MIGENKMPANAWFPCYPRDLTGDTDHLSNHDFGAYVRVLCWYYTNGPLPNDDDSLRNLMRVEKIEWQRTKGNVLSFFDLNGDGKWHQKRADEIIEERARIVSATIENSKKGVEARRKLGQLPPHPKDEPLVEPLVNQGIDQRRTQSQSQSHVQEKRESTRFAPPSLEEVKLNGAKIGLSASECEKFHAYYQSNGWRVGRNPMKSWPSAMIHWKGNVRNPMVPVKPAIAPQVMRSMEQLVKCIGET